MQYLDELVLINRVSFIANKIEECLTRLNAIEEAIKTRQLPDAYGIGEPND